MTVTMEVNHFIYCQGIDRNDPVAVGVQGARDKVAGAKAVCLLSREVYESDPFRKSSTFVELSNETRQDTEAVVVRKDVIVMLVLVPANFDVNQIYLGDVASVVVTLHHEATHALVQVSVRTFV